MEKVKGLFIILISGMLLVGCGKETAYEDRNMSILEIQADNILYFTLQPDSDMLLCTKEGEQAVFCYRPDGTMDGQFAIERENFFPQLLCCSGERIYCFSEHTHSLLGINLDTGEVECAITLTPNFFGEKLVCTDWGILLMYQNYNADFGDRKLYLFDNELKGCSDLLPDTKITGISADENQFMISYTVGEKKVYSLWEEHGMLDTFLVEGLECELYDFAYSREDNCIYGYQIDRMQYVKIDLSDPEKIARFNGQRIYSFVHGMQQKNGRLFFLDRENDTVYEMDVNAYVRDNEPLKAYVMEFSQVPDWGGFQIDLEELSWEDMALRILAGDEDYDFVVLNTGMSQAMSVRQAGAYYPIPEDTIVDYWKSCFPCIKEAASEDGEIWMLPIHLYAQGMYYNENKWQEYGLSMAQIQTYRDLAQFGTMLVNEGQTGNFALPVSRERLVNEYMQMQRTAGKLTFDTQEFREILDFVSGELTEPYLSSYVNTDWAFGVKFMQEHAELQEIELQKAMMREDMKRVYFEVANTFDDFLLEKYEDVEGGHIAKIPTFFGNSLPTPIYADIIIINPNSARIDTALEFVHTLASSYINNTERHLSSEAAVCEYDKKINVLFMDGEIQFAYPEEIFTPYNDFLVGTMGREETVVEMERRLQMYLHE